MLRVVRPTVRVLALVLLAACGGGAGDSPTGGNPPVPKNASLTVTVANVPDSATANITVEGPNGFSRVVSSTTTITSLAPGSYRLTAATVETESAIYAPSPATQNVELPGGVERAVEVSYALASATLAVTISGLPAQRDAAVTITGPNNYSRQLTKNETLRKLAPGAYVIGATSVMADGDGYAVASLPPAVNLSAAAAPFVVEVTYALATGRLQVHANGLPQGASLSFQVSGPHGFSQTALPDQVLSGLAPGTYSISAPNVVIGGTTYTPSSSSVTVTIVSSLVAAQANVAYMLSGGGGGGGGGSGQINLTIDNLYITQAVQTYTGEVPLVAGRDGLVRVFAKASGTNTAQPQVRVRLYNADNLVHTLILNAPAPSVPTVIDDATLASAWYGVVPATYIQLGLRVVADVDPGNIVAENSETDNTFTATMNVRTVPTFFVRFVPIKQSNDLTGNVSLSNTDAFLNDMRRMYPLAAIDADVRAVYTTSAAVVEANDHNGAWNVVLSEINALRMIDASARHYYGVLKTSYSSGVAGMGYLGSPTAIGWDHQPSGADVMAHELGHNFGRYHAPCGGAGFPDTSYPYSGGRIGVTGYDLTTGAFKLPTTPDLMGYCVPNWVSDYTYKGIMNYRGGQAAVANAAEPGILVWGRISGNEIVLEPAFDVTATPALPKRSGAHRLEGLADDGSQLFSFAFEGDAVDHAQPDDRSFAFVVPKTALRGRSLATLRLRGRGRVAEQRSSHASTVALATDDAHSPRVRRSGARAAQVSWSTPEIRGVLVRNATTGEVLSIVRGGSGHFEPGAADIELVLSDGVRSRIRRTLVR